MKKFLGIIILSLFLNGNAYSKTDVDSAIEKCADAQFLGNEEGISKVIFEKNKVYNQLLKDRDLQQKNYNEFIVFFEATFKKYREDNAKPKYPTLESNWLNDYEAYKKANTEWDKKKDEYMLPYTNKVKFIGNNFSKQNKLIKEMKKSLTEIYLKKLDLKNKAKIIRGYASQFQICENSHNTTPKGFMLMWGY